MTAFRNQSGVDMGRGAPVRNATVSLLYLGILDKFNFLVVFPYCIYEHSLLLFFFPLLFYIKLHLT